MLSEVRRGALTIDFSFTLERLCVAFGNTRVSGVLCVWDSGPQTALLVSCARPRLLQVPPWRVLVIGSLSLNRFCFNGRAFFTYTFTLGLP